MVQHDGDRKVTAEGDTIEFSGGTGLSSGSKKRPRPVMKATSQEV